ncbi:class I SAM-dependent methyltransferase [Rhodococcus sp. BP-149]|uniref:cyclopropane mycolic acid synthase family methyltransferase n=1 Tax=unclassified Rhodococcus (in: high G+C Gram-positive bacteria) TaxID=192944 RepID=UPI001C9A7F79|nr:MULTISPECIES: cyclopropane mycolic acid synthase family methyltransferase [unclassified Rhodococcus (in: high G+C Gram-positive bacteria)]MBY6686234.1 class I SAM-dependent methyltransferase [Rhodococcus sp. BP-288]MBY6693677.1 class I SAM-dependent methyltransferase [Rhodococcus sp. BP-188]MBY6699726.1 class I SAM-dependent methyltransferase [Rhodococcus sp. BP-285]MBY6703929.1 class I SAM-dependent methyltransferase [Rhodococcus sp. BP-283]MBY6710923.1 class I SAM-dependent methyltransfer
MSDLQPFYDDVQAHYDLSDEFFRLFLDPTQTYSCAYFEREDMTLEEAQLAKIDLSLSKCDLRPGMRLLDVGCGWGATLRRAVEKYDVNVVGLTLSRNQYEHVSAMLNGLDTGRTTEVRLQGWEEFDEPVDRIVSIGAFEHFTSPRYDDFFARAYSILPGDGRMMLHTIVQLGRDMFRQKSRVTRADMDFADFIGREIFPGGELPIPQVVIEKGERAGFRVEKVQSLQQHYARTLDLWSAALEARKDEAVAIADEAMYQTYMRYLPGCADFFRRELIDVRQFTMVK